MERYKQVKIASILGMLGNFFLSIIKIVVALFTNSQAMLGDAFNSLSDILASFMTFLGNFIASKPKDEDHNLGHGKAEYIYSLFISFTMFVLALNMAKDAIYSFFRPQNYHFSYFLIVVSLITMFVKIILYLYTNRVAKKMNNVLLKANCKDHFLDTIIAFFTLISSCLGFYNITIFDSIVGLGISFYIIYSAYLIFKQSYDVLMDKSISEERKKEVLKIIEKYPEIKKINHFNSTPVGYKYYLSFTIFVNGHMSTIDSHAIANNLEKEIIKEIPEIYLVIIHVNPIV